jgi:VWFA-related protein
MRTAPRRSFLLPALLGLSTLAAIAQQESTPITLDVSVTARSGVPVPNLTLPDFTLLVDKKPHPFTAFQAINNDQPVQVLLVIDNIDIGYNMLTSVRQQLENFLHANAGHLPNPTEVAIASDIGVSLQHGFTADGNAAADFVHRTFIPRRTNHDASVFGATQRFQVALNTFGQLIDREQGLPGRKIMLWVSPGWPIFNSANEALSSGQQSNVFTQIVTLSNALRRNGITLYQVNPLGATEDIGGVRYYDNFLDAATRPSQVNLGNISLQVLSLQSGGLMLTSNNVAEMLNRCYADIDTFYRLTFTPPASAHPQQYHSLEVRISRPGLNVRTRSGFYSAP